MQRQKYIAVDLEFELLLQKSSMSNCIYISWFLLQIIILFQIIKGLSLKAFFVLSLKESVCRCPLSSQLLPNLNHLLSLNFQTFQRIILVLIKIHYQSGECGNFWFLSPIDHVAIAICCACTPARMCCVDWRSVCECVIVVVFVVAEG